MEDKNLDTIDLMKLILACLMVPTHMQAFQDHAPVMIFLSRFTIPLFFITSSYFFFRGVGRRPDDLIWRETRLRKFELRVFRLYLAWELIQLPITIRNWNGPLLDEPGGIRYFMLRLFLGNTFFASWYLKALMIGLMIVAVLSSKLTNRGLFAIGFVSYMVCCLNSGYEELGLLQIHSISAPNTFLAALIWLVIGKIIAEDGKTIRAFHAWEKGKKFSGLLLTLLLYVIEYLLCMRMKLARQTDNMLFLIPVCTIIFLLVMESGIRLRHAADLRAASTVIYCAHGSVMAILFSIGKRIAVNFEVPPMAYGCYVLVLILCSAMSVCITRLSRLKGMHWLGWFC